jgi:hypothetical protein
VRGVFRHCNITIVGFYYLSSCCMFRPYDHLQVEIYLLELTLLITDFSVVTVHCDLLICHNLEKLALQPQRGMTDRRSDPCIYITGIVTGFGVLFDRSEGQDREQHLETKDSFSRLLPLFQKEVYLINKNWIMF